MVAGEFPFPVPYPVVLGHESIGRVTDVGPRVRHLEPGDLVTRVGTPPGGGIGAAWGGFAEIGIARDHQAMKEDGLPEQEWRPYRIHQIVPGSIDPAGAPMIITWRETLSYLTRAGVRPESHLLIVGSGGNGVAFTAHAANLGARAVVMIGSARRADVARRAGATGYHDYTSPDLAARLETAYPDGFDVLIDAVGRRGTAGLGLAHLKHGGTVGIYGLDDWGTLTINPAQARGTFTYYNGGYDEAEVHHEVIQSMQAGRLDPWLWLPSGTPLTLTDLPQAFRPESDARSLKTLVRLSGHVPPPAFPSPLQSRHAAKAVTSRRPGRD